jgi:hypothetical protein
MTVNKHDRLQLIRRAAEGEAATPATIAPEPTKTSGKLFYRRARTLVIPPKYDGRHRALANSMFTTLRSS